MNNDTGSMAQGTPASAERTLNIAFSPCPNDTFIFHALVHGLVPGAPQFSVTYADIDVTNGLAARREGPEILKISYAALPWVLDDYALLPCGGALGRGCGPLVLVRGGENGGEQVNQSDGTSDGGEQVRQANGASDGGERAGQSDGALDDIGQTRQLDQAPGRSLQAADLAGRRVAVPSDRSTAYLLFRLWAAKNVPGGVGDIVVMPFNEIMPAVQRGDIDAGLVIHEARFTYRSYGLSMLADLGSWWEEDTGRPIPLGAIVAKRSLPLHDLAAWIRASVQYAWAHPDASRDYVLQHAQEMDPDVARRHIELYVNEYSENLGADGYGAVEALLTRAAEEGLVPRFDASLLRNF